MSNFDARAKDWDKEPVRRERAQAAARAMRELLPLSDKLHALEYGCGTGLLSFELQPYIGHITLADSSPGMLEVLREKIAAAGVANMIPLELDFSTGNLPSERYDLLYNLLVLHHIPDTGQILSAFYTVLKPGGILCAADLDKEDGSFHAYEFHGHLGFDREELAAMAASAGFTNIRFSTIFHQIMERDGVMKSYPIFLMLAYKPG